MLPPALQSALAALDDEPVSGRDKGLPAIALRFGDIGRQGWNVLAGDLPLPAMLLRWADVQHNIQVMQAYAGRHGAWLAPHGKTSMAPQLFAAQLQAGAWAITLANMAQLQVARAFGIQRLLLANELVSDYDVRHLARGLCSDPDFEPYVLVDSPAAIARLTQALERDDPGRPVNVLVELGMPGGRCGARSVPELQALAEAVLKAGSRLRLAGVEGYEGIVSSNTLADSRTAAEEYLQRLAGAVRAIQSMAPATHPFLVTAGGSVFFDLVVEHLGREALPEAQLVLRPGSYVSHDSIHLDDASPLGRLGPAGPAGRLRPAFEVWAVVLSRPEPDLAILGMGKRDVPVDLDLPLPLYHSRGGAPPTSLGEGYHFFRVQDQHAYLRLPAGADLAVGDLVGSGISHPCTTFDKWRVLLLADEARHVVGAIRTYF